MRKVAVLITCYNRKETTLRCLRDIYSQRLSEGFALDLYVVDGGSCDDTPAAVRLKYPLVYTFVFPGLYWAGGMRAAWSKAVQTQEYDYYWLVNDDTNIYPECLLELLKADGYAQKTFNNGGIYIGTTKDPVEDVVTYGGRRLRWQGDNKGELIIPDGTNYQSCELGNANIMLVSREVFDRIGGFCERYTHGIADYDYTLRAARAGFPVIICPTYCGECVNDSGNRRLSQSSPLKARIQYLYSPKGLAYNEYLYYIREFFPRKYYSAILKLWLKTMFPFLWAYLKRGDA